MTRSEVFLTTVDILLSKTSLEVVGEHGSGRTHILRRVRDHFVTLGWRPIEITGIEAFRRANLAALALAGIVETTDARSSPLVTAYRSLQEQLKKGRTLFIIDDADSLDEASWGVISTVSARHGVPMLIARLSHRPAHSPVHPTSGFTAILTQVLEPMSYGELEAQLSTALGARIEASTMSRIFAKTNGNIGIALTMIDAAVRAGTLHVEDGVARATGSLWTSSLRAVIDMILQPIDTDDIAALRALSLIGPIDLASAVRVVDESVVLRLEELAFVTVIRAGARRIVTVNPPLLVEYFRQEAPVGQRAVLLERIDDSLAAGVLPVGDAELSPQVSSTYVRIIHEHARLRTLRARADWHERRTLPHATALMDALNGDLGNVSDEIEALLAAVARLEGTEHERAGFEIVYATHVAHQHSERIPEAVVRLRDAAAELPSQELRLQAHSALLDDVFGRVSEIERFADVDLGALDDVTRRDVLAARVQWLLVRGRVREADRLLAETSGWGEDDLRLEALAVLCHIALGDHNLASRLATERLAVARAQIDAAGIRLFSYLVALAALFERRFFEAETTVEEAVAIGLAVGEAPSSFVGLTIVASYIAVKHGGRAMMAEYFAELDASGYPDTTLLGQQRGWVLARLAILDGDRVGAARLSRQTADELWERGARLAAAYHYLDGLRMVPDADDLAHAAPRIAEIDADGVQDLFVFTRALVERDAPTLLSSVKRVVDAGARDEAVHSARLALRVLADGDGALPSSEATDGLLAIAALGGGVTAGHGVFAELTPRELEVAELVASGLSNPLIAEALVVSVRTVESHVNKLIKKIGGRRRQDIREYLLATGVKL